MIVAAVVTYFTAGWASGWAAGWVAAAGITGATASAIATGALVGAVAGFAGGAVMTGTLKGALTGAVSGALFGGIDGYFDKMANLQGGVLNGGQFAGKVLSHASAGGVMNDLQGGKFGHGFISAGMTAAFGGSIDNIDKGQSRSLLRVMAASAVGGTTSKLTGGKFANGAMTGAFSRALNDEMKGYHAQKVVRTESEDSILYERGNASVLVKNNDLNGPIPDVGMKQINHALDISAAEGQQLQIISGHRLDSSAHKLYGAIDVYIDGYTTEQTAEALYKSGHFNRVSSYTGRYTQKWGGRMSTAHGDYKAGGNQGLFEDWVHQRK